MTKIVVEILLDPAQTSVEKREEMRRAVEFVVDGAIDSCFDTMGRRGKEVPDYEVSSRVEEDS